MSKDDDNITNWLDPSYHINSEYGVIRNVDWAKREQKRIKHCDIIKDKDGLIALRKQTN